jgi:hypothetical protein
MTASSFDASGAATEALRSGKTPNGSTAPPMRLPPGFSDKELLDAEIDDPIFVLPGLIPEGLTVLAGRPKSGKTTLAMNIADAVARGGMALGAISCPKIEVLFLALEDNRRRLQRRRRMLTKAENLGHAPGLHYHLTWPRLNEGGLDLLDQFLAGNKAVKLVIFDTWKRVCPHRRRDQDDYQHESDAATLLQKLAAKHQVAIVIIHHSRKGPGSDDFVDDVLGSTGLTGAVDTIIGFRRKRGTGDAEISVTGRDVDECEKALAGDHTTGKWRLLGDAGEQRMSRARRAIVELLKDGKMRTIAEVADRLGEKYDNVRMNLAAMVDDGQLTRIGKSYTLPT